MTCEHCDDGTGVSCYPVYGPAPHDSIVSDDGVPVAYSHTLPETEWPANYHPDPDEPGEGIYSCPDCGAGKPGVDK